MLSKLMQSWGYPLEFKILEIGAVPLGDSVEPFHFLINQFPSSQIIGFEVDTALCERLNASAPKGMSFFPYALGRTEEARDFYETHHPMCCSLYKPNEAYLDLFQNLEVAKLKKTSSVQTISLDSVSKTHSIGPVDFIKIDIQGAELEVFQGGENLLQDVLLIVCEVEFVPLYENQPLFGDVCSFLQNQGFSFHKFLGLAGRVMKPLQMGNNPNTAQQHMWSDAVFMRDLLKLENLEPHQLLKLALLLEIYKSPDVALFVLKNYDLRCGTHHADEYLETLLAASSKDPAPPKQP